MIKYYFFTYVIGSSKPRHGYGALSDPYFSDILQTNVVLAQNMKSGLISEVPLTSFMNKQVYTESLKRSFNNILEKLGE